MNRAESIWIRGSHSLLDAPAQERVAESPASTEPPPVKGRHDRSTSLRAMGETVVSHWRTVSMVVGALLLACLLYCLIAPKQYEGRGRVALRLGPATALNIDGTDRAASGSVASGQTQLETLADVFRSDQLAWRVILEKKLYEGPDFKKGFSAKFPDFRQDAPPADAEAYLLEEFRTRLHVETLPRTLLFEIRFRSKDAAVSADVVNALIHAYGEQEAEMRIRATGQAAEWLQSQLKELKAKADREDRRMAEFQKRHKILISPQTLSNGQPGQAPHLSALLAVDQLSRELVSASSERILREAQYRAASQGDPELVLWSDAGMLGESGGVATAALRQIEARRSELEQERALLSLEHGPNFPRVLEIQQLLQDLERQGQAEDVKLKDRFHSAWQTALDREQLLRRSLSERMSEGLLVNEAATQYEAMREEADASHALYMRMQDKVEEAGLAAGVHAPDLWVVDVAHRPAKPVSPNLPMYMAITLFASLWLAGGAALLMESLRGSAGRVIVVVLAASVWGAGAQAQAPTPSNSGLPTGVARIPGSTETKSAPNPRNAPAVWTGNAGPSQAGLPAASASSSSAPMAAPIAPGDLLDISEFHMPEFHTSARVSAAGTVTLPLVNEVNVEGLSEPEAAKAIADKLVGHGMLLHPQVFVVVTAYVGQDVSVLGEVARPGIYAYAQHHRLLDLISAASGLSAGAGSLVTIYHRDDLKAAHLVVLGAGGSNSDQNPELAPGDTVQVSRGGLIYVVGDVIRPGGFAVDGTQATTVLQALALAWGPSQNAALKKALLIREQDDGRTVTSLNLKRMLRGEDPDLPVRERDILFVPDSAAKNLWNRTIESAIQSAAGVSIYSGLVYSQRF